MSTTAGNDDTQAQRGTDPGSPGRDQSGQTQHSDSSGGTLSHLELKSGTTDYSQETIERLHALINTKRSAENWISIDEIEQIIRSEDIDYKWLVAKAYRKQQIDFSSNSFSDNVTYPTESGNITRESSARFIGISAILSLLFAILVGLFAIEGLIPRATAFAIGSVLVAYTIGAGKTWLDYR
jgi:hypothetical protein